MNGSPEDIRLLNPEPPARWREAVVARLNDLCRLPVGWNGYGAGPVEFGTALFALQMLECACPANAPAPSIVPGADGDLQVEWHLGTADIELHVRAPNDVEAWRETTGTGAEGEHLKPTVDFSAIARWLSDLTEPTVAAEATAA